MKKLYYAFAVVTITTSLAANILDEELDLRLSDSQVNNLEQVSDEELVAFEQELAQLAQKAEAEEQEVQPEEEVVIVEEEQPEEMVIQEELPQDKERAQQEELQKLLEELAREEQDNE